MSIGPTPSRLLFGVVMAGLVLVGSGLWLARQAHLASTFSWRRIVAESPFRRSVPVSALSGIATGPDGAPMTVELRLAPTGIAGQPVPNRFRGNGPGGFVPRGVTATSSASGRFTFPSVEAGSYWLTAHAETLAAAPSLPRELWGAREVHADGKAALDAPIRLDYGPTVTGHVVLNATSSAEHAPPSIALAPTDEPTRAQMRTQRRALPSSDGTFQIANLALGTYTLDVDPGADWVLDDASGDGADWMDNAIDLTASGRIAHLTLTFSDHPNRIDGIIRAPGGEPAPFGLVMAFSSDAALRHNPRRVQAVRAAVDGRFTLSGFPDGDYIVAPAGYVDPVEWYTQPFFAKLTMGTTPVTVKGGERKAVSLQIRFAR